MDFPTFTRLLAGAAAVFCLSMLGLRLRAFLALPYKPEVALTKGKVAPGLAYAFTMGMAPWAKESTRRHAIAYVRGILFHVGIFTALATLFLGVILYPHPAFAWPAGSLAWIRYLLAILVGIGALSGLGGFWQRLMGERERALSTPDDLAAVALVSLFMITAFAALLSDAWLAIFYLVSAIMLVYVPFSKIRHFLYFFFSRFFFGIKYSRRGAIGWSKVHLEG